MIVRSYPTYHDFALVHCFDRIERESSDDYLSVASNDAVLGDDYLDSNIWIVDSGATSHLTHTDYGMFNITVKQIRAEISVGDGNTVVATKQGDIRVAAYNKEGCYKTEFILRDVNYVPGLMINLISMSTALTAGFEIGNEGLVIFIKSGNFRLSFDQLFPCGSGFLGGVELVRAKPTRRSLSPYK